jgi:hypothetical protein
MLRFIRHPYIRQLLFTKKYCSLVEDIERWPNINFSKIISDAKPKYATYRIFAVDVKY